jgi:hypothetical protein
MTHTLKQTATLMPWFIAESWADLSECGVGLHKKMILVGTVFFQSVIIRLLT